MGIFLVGLGIVKGFLSEELKDIFNFQYDPTLKPIITTIPRYRRDYRKKVIITIKAQN